MNEEHKEKMRLAREASRARKEAVDVEELPTIEGAVKREKAAHEHETISGYEKVNDPGAIPGVQAEVQESLRRMLREELAQVLPERQVARTSARDSVRPNAVIAKDRDGNPIYRKRDALADQFAIPDELQEPGWDFAWIRVSTFGQEDVGNQVARFENGWRFVPADRPGWAGRFMPLGYKGHIYKDGLALVERPMELTEEARREDASLVRNQMRSQREQFGLALPEGFSDRTEAARAFTFARKGQREATPSNLKPEHQVSGLDIDH